MPEDSADAAPDTPAGLDADASAKPSDRARITGTIVSHISDQARRTTEAAKAHIATLVERLRLVNRQWKEAHGRLDALTEAFANEEPEPGQKCEQRDVDILRS